MNVTYRIECHPEDEPIRGNVMASGDDSLDKETEDSVIADLEAGNPWAWCQIRVVASIDDFEGEDWLSGCSYVDENQFCADGYFGDMKAAALESLKGVLAGEIARGERARSLLAEIKQTRPH